LAGLTYLIALAKARLRAETRRDHFFDPEQTVVNLASLMTADKTAIQQALSDEKFKTPISEKITDALMQTTKPDWQRQYLERKTRKASYDDLVVIRRALTEKKIPYRLTLRMNPVRKFGSLSAPVVRFSGCHEDLRRHLLLRAREEAQAMRQE